MKILIVKTSSLGDIVQTFPVVNYLRQRFPVAQLDWVVESRFGNLVEAHPYIDRFIPIHTDKWRKFQNLSSLISQRKYLRKIHYDVAFDLQGNIKSGFMLSQARAKDKVGFGRHTSAEWPNHFFSQYHFDPTPGRNIREDYLFVVQSFFNDPTPYRDLGVKLMINNEQEERISGLVKGKTIMVCPGSAWKNKQLRTSTLIEFLTEIKNTQFLLVWGNQKEFQQVQRIHQAFPERSHILDRLELPVLQNLMAKVDLVIGMDSLPLHLAGTTSTPTLSFFGPSSSKKYCPIGEQHRSIQGSCPYQISFEKRCPKLRSCSTGACLRELKVDQNQDVFRQD